MAIVTCHTEGCGSAGVPIDAPMSYEDGGVVYEVTAGAVCGACDQPIADITGV